MPPAVPILLYPDGDALKAFLRGAGVLKTTLTAAQEELDYDGVMDAAVTEFENTTNRYPFLSTHEVLTKTFRGKHRNPHFLPTGIYLAELDDAEDAITVNGESYVVGTDVLLLPENAPEAGLPYSRFVFAKGRAYQYRNLLPHPPPGWGSGPIEIAIRGKWGFCLELPADVNRALLCYGASELAPQLALTLTGGVQSVRRLNFEIKYGSGAQAPLVSEGAAWRAVFDKCANRAPYKAF